MCACVRVYDKRQERGRMNGKGSKLCIARSLIQIDKNESRISIRIEAISFSPYSFDPQVNINFMHQYYVSTLCINN